MISLRARTEQLTRLDFHQLDCGLAGRYRTAAFRPLEAVGVFLCTTVRIILLSTTIPISGLDHMACALATPGSVPLLAATHAGSLLTCWRGFCQVGLEPSPVLTHWATATNFMGLLPLPRFRAYLGATSAWFGQGPTSDSHSLCRCSWMGCTRLRPTIPPHACGSSGSCAPCQTATTHTVVSLMR